MNFWNWLKSLFEKKSVKEKIGVPVENPALLAEPPVVPMQVTITENVADINRLALQMTGSFEGKGFTEVSGNFDGQGLSCGILQWCYGQGSLQQKILRPYIAKYGSIDGLGIFPGSVDVTASMSAGNAIAYAKLHMLSGIKVKSNWNVAWEKFLARLDVTDIQMTAAKDVLDRAHTMAENWGMGKSPRAICFFFDIVTQNGSIQIGKPVASRASAMSYSGVATNKKNRSIWADAISSAPDEQLILFQAAYLRARKSNPQWFQDVFSRKGSIALGVGVVHGATMSLNPKFKALDQRIG